MFARLVPAPVFKTGDGREQRPWWVRFPSTPARPGSAFGRRRGRHGGAVTRRRNCCASSSSIGASSPAGVTIQLKPALAKAHLNREFVVAHGTGLELAAPLKFHHAANLPFSVRGTGVSFKPETGLAHSSNEPVQPLGTGITLDQPLTRDHDINEAVRGAQVAAAGYQGSAAPNQWFGGPALSAGGGAMILREATGLVVDSLNYGLMVDPWASEGYHGLSGTGQGGCRVPSPAPPVGFGPAPPAAMMNRSAGRFPDGADTDSNCTDFLLQPATTLRAASAAGANNLKVGSVAEFAPGQAVLIDAGADQETAVIQTVGTAGATTVRTAVDAGGTVIPVALGMGFTAGQAITIDDGATREAAVVSATTFGRAGSTITVSRPLAKAHAAGVQVSGTGITLGSALTKAHASGAQVTRSLPTPGAPNQYFRSR